MRRLPRCPARLASLVLAAVAGSALAADEPASGDAFAPPGLRWDAWTLQPQLLVATGHNDNLRLQSAGQRRSAFVALFPTVQLQRQDGSSRLNLGWRAERTTYLSSRLDDSTNTELSADGIHLLGTRTAVAWRAAGQEWHDSVSQPDPSQPALPPDRYLAAAAGLVWRHDLALAEGASPRLELDASASRKRYRTQRALTILADADSASLIGRVLVPLAEPERRAGVELRRLRQRYPNSYQSLSHTDVRLLGLLQWEPTAEWSGQLQAGPQQRRFDRLRPTQGLLSWSGELRWQATPRRSLELGGQREASDVPGDGADAVLGTRWQLAWHEQWGATRASLTLAQVRSHYVNGFQPRDDRLRSADLALRHDLGRHWQVGLNLGWLQRRSSISGFDFTRQLGSVVLSTGL
ncbi:outer membrane beta-barrel protein [Ideonella sp. 4Y11]|uniref:Outer membrane beta-barrel protein n=1 Tax=Ideonella aquatica TaxID=2824119 RepID=A0A940YXY6_9BURK|nr:outer membrane beta-barrel protein [Ideonella aquatica]MBQ0961195.1 outer membrane beta-barrel protein [Ideonella aquatica]